MLSQDTDVGGRFRVERELSSAGAGTLYLATDLRTTRQASLWVHPAEALGDTSTLQELQATVKAATSLSHRNIVPVFGTGQETDGSVYVANELIDGTTIADLVKTKAQNAKSFSPRGAYNVLSHVVNALSYAQPKLIHGVLTADAVIISRTSQIMVSDYGLSPLLTRLDSFLQGSMRYYLAPEVVAGELPTERSDVYSLGALLYFMIAGIPPQVGGKPPPSSMQSLIPGEFDDFVARAMDPLPRARMADAREFRSQLLALVEIWGAPKIPPGEEWPFDDELTLVGAGKATLPAPLTQPTGKPTKVSDIPVSWDADPSENSQQYLSSPAAFEPPVENGTELPSSESSRGAGSVAIPPPAVAPAPIAAVSAPEPSSGAIDFDQLLGAPPAANSEGSSEMIDLGTLISEATQTENQIWMVHVDKFDHGPFSARELAQQIFNGQISDDDIVLNMETGVRQRCAMWSEFGPILDKARVKRREAEESKAAQRVETVEKRVGVLRYIIAAGIVIVIGLGIGTYFIYRAATRDTMEGGDELADLVEAGDVTIATGAGILPIEETKNKRRRGRRRGRPGGGGGAGMTAEEAMAQGIDYGDLSGGTRQLTVSQINSVMGRNTGRFYSCLAGHNGRVNLDFVINGDGSVSGVSVPGATGPMRSCMASRMRGVRFPAFDAPRMRATFFFEVGR